MTVAHEIFQNRQVVCSSAALVRVPLRPPEYQLHTTHQSNLDWELLLLQAYLGIGAP